MGNYIGTDFTGTLKLGNGISGVAFGEASNNTIGGAQAGAGNVISANADYGISFADCSGMLVQDNYIGLDETGGNGNVMKNVVGTWDDNNQAANQYVNNQTN